MHLLISSAFGWLRERRETSSPHDGVWRLRSGPLEAKAAVRRALETGLHRFEPVDLFQDKKSGEWIERRSAFDALLLKTMALALTPALARSLPCSCVHLPGRGGAKGAVRINDRALASGRFRYVYRTDIREYYASIDHSILLDAMRRWLPAQGSHGVSRSAFVSLTAAFLDRTTCRGGVYRRRDKRGISRGTSLSPLLGAVYLADLDQRMEGLCVRRGLFYLRFMDDFIILAPNRHKLREAIRAVNQTLNDLKVEPHPDKTFIGRIERGFDFCGYQFSSDGIQGISQRSLRRLAENVSQRYARGDSKEAVERYLHRWSGWAFGGLRSAKDTNEQSNKEKDLKRYSDDETGIGNRSEKNRARTGSAKPSTATSPLFAFASCARPPASSVSTPLSSQFAC